MANLREVVKVPTKLEVREATPPGRAPYIAARKALDAAAVFNGNFDRGCSELVATVRGAYDELHDAMQKGALDPPIEPNSDLGGLVADFNEFYRNGKSPFKDELETSVEALYLVVDHGSRAPVSSKGHGTEL